MTIFLLYNFISKIKNEEIFLSSIIVYILYNIHFFIIYKFIFYLLIIYL
jgi:hypothetical protein